MLFDPTDGDARARLYATIRSGAAIFLSPGSPSSFHLGPVMQSMEPGPVQQVQGGGDTFWDSHCPATMGGKCRYQDGVCKMCGRQKA